MYLTKPKINMKVMLERIQVKKMLRSERRMEKDWSSRRHWMRRMSDQKVRMKEIRLRKTEGVPPASWMKAVDGSRARKISQGRRLREVGIFDQARAVRREADGA
jgi:hypothetical protein